MTLQRQSLQLKDTSNKEEYVVAGTMNPSLGSLRNLLQRGLPIRRSRYPPPSATLASHDGHDRMHQHNNYPNPNRSDRIATCIAKTEPPHLIFPGAGLFFYWQAGVVTYFRQAGYDLSKTTMSGASAVAIAAEQGRRAERECGSDFPDPVIRTG